MPSTIKKCQNFDVTPEQEDEIAWLREVLGASSAEDAVLRAVRITAVLAREVKAGGGLMVARPGGCSERIVIPEFEQPSKGGWRYLVEREHPWRRQMSIKGTRLLAATVWRDMIANQQTAAEAAEEWGLPLEAVEETHRWCEENQPLLELEAREESRRLFAAGYDHAHPR